MNLDSIHPESVISVCAFLAVIFGVMYFLINASKDALEKQMTRMGSELKENQARMESQIKENQARMESQIKENQARMESELKENQARMESELKENQVRMESQIKDNQKNIKNILLLFQNLETTIKTIKNKVETIESTLE